MIEETRQPIRILHVVGGMNRGGIETWLMHVLRHIDRERFQMDFLVHTTDPCDYDDEVRALGSKIIPCPHPHRPLVYAHGFRRVLREHGPYDITHSHVHHYSGWVLTVAHRAGVPVRIAHCHNDSSSAKSGASLPRRKYLDLTEKLIGKHATQGLACSIPAAVDLFGSDWSNDSRWRVLHYGIDLSPFQANGSPDEARRSLGIPPDAFVMGHVGRFAPQKNHAFLIEIAAALCQLEPRVTVLLVGDGPLRPHIEQQARQAGIAQRIRFAGVRSDVPKLMRDAMDVFVFPSHFEGLGLVLVEAQAAGLYCAFSDTIPQEVDIVPQLMKRLSLQQTPADWAEVILARLEEKRTISRAESLAMVENSPFNIQASVRALESTYQNG